MKSQRELSWGLFCTFYCDEVENHVQQAPAVPISFDAKEIGTTQTYTWLSKCEDASLFTLDGFSVLEATNIIVGLRLQPRTLLRNSNHKTHKSVGRLRWFDISIPTTSLTYSGGTTPHARTLARRRSSFYFDTPYNNKIEKEKHIYMQHVLDNCGTIIVKYEAARYFDPKTGQNVGQIIIDSVSVTIEDNAIIKNAVVHKGHRITCLVQTMDRSKQQIALTQAYLGRAQRVSTNADPKQRTYEWKSDPSNASNFPGMTPRYTSEVDWEQHQEEKHDLDMIRLSSGDTKPTHNKGDLSHRQSFCLPNLYVPDNDMYSNPRYRLPIFFHKQHAMTIKLYNLKFTPPRCIEHTLRWRDFEAADARSVVSSKKKGKRKSLFWAKKNNELPAQVKKCLERNVSADMLLLVYFYRNEQEDKERVRFDSIVLVANDYETSLDMCGYQTGVVTV